MLLNTEAFTRESLYTEKLLHTEDFAQKSGLHINFCTQKLLHTDAFTQECLHTDAFSLHAQKLLRRVAFT